MNTINVYLSLRFVIVRRQLESYESVCYAESTAARSTSFLHDILIYDNLGGNDRMKYTRIPKTYVSKLGLVEDLVIQVTYAIGRPKFEDGLRMGEVGRTALLRPLQWINSYF